MIDKSWFGCLKLFLISSDSGDIYSEIAIL